MNLSEMTQERWEKERGPAKPIGEDEVCRGCECKAKRSFGYSPTFNGFGFVSNIDGWTAFFTYAPIAEGAYHPVLFKFCPKCMVEVVKLAEYLKAKSAGDIGPLDVDLLCDDAP